MAGTVELGDPPGSRTTRRPGPGTRTEKGSRNPPGGAGTSATCWPRNRSSTAMRRASGSVTKTRRVAPSTPNVRFGRSAYSNATERGLTSTRPPVVAVSACWADAGTPVGATSNRAIASNDNLNTTSSSLVPSLRDRPLGPSRRAVGGVDVRAYLLQARLPGQDCGATPSDALGITAVRVTDG